jgi:hypothetical protein
MRCLLKVNIPVEAGNTAARAAPAIEQAVKKYG